jgi:hypothetical protein
MDKSRIAVIAVRGGTGLVDCVEQRPVDPEKLPIDEESRARLMRWMYVFEHDRPAIDSKTAKEFVTEGREIMLTLRAALPNDKIGYADSFAEARNIEMRRRDFPEHEHRDPWDPKIHLYYCYIAMF